ncbi:MAG: PEP-CTERM sorting domain-containing protein [Planctomycetota bacterium]|jgi:hypothetical protein
MNKKAEIIAVLFVVLSLWIGNLRAEIVTIYLTAEVTHVGDTADLLEGKVTTEDIITGSYTYDSDTPDSEPLSTGGVYWHYNPPCGINLSVGGFVFQTDPDNVELLFGIDNGTYGHDAYHVTSYNNLPLSNGVEINAIVWQLDDYTETALSSDSLPTTPPVLDDWDGNYLLLACGPYSVVTVGARVTSAVPEPATFLLLALGSLLLTRRGR